MKRFFCCKFTFKSNSNFVIIIIITMRVSIFTCLLEMISHSHFLIFHFPYTRIDKHETSENLFLLHLHLPLLAVLVESGKKMRRKSFENRKLSLIFFHHDMLLFLDFSSTIMRGKPGGKKSKLADFL